MKENKKYQLLEDDTIVREGRTLYRIEALRHVCYGVEAGTKGGYVESEANLSHKGTCWLYDDACAYEESRVEGDAYLYGHATLRGKAKLIEDASLWGKAILQGEAKVGGNVSLQNDAVVGGQAILKGWMILYDAVQVGGNAYLEGTHPDRNLVLDGTTIIDGDTIMKGYGRFPEKEAILTTGSFRLEGNEHE